MKPLNIVQVLLLELMRQASFNEFDGNRVASDLLANRHLWQACFIDRAAWFADARRRELTSGRDPLPQYSIEPIDLIRLRDLPDGYWNVDTLYILPEDGADDELLALASTWAADEIHWIDGGDVRRTVLRVWWD